MQHILGILLAVLLLPWCAGCGETSYNIATGRQELLFISEERELAIGRAMAKSYEEHYPILLDEKETAWIDGIGQRLVEASDRRSIEYRFRIIEDDTYNAVSLPGGHIYINTGLIEELERNEDAIACVLAHEIAHVACKHSVKKMQSSTGYGVLRALVGFGVADPDLNQGVDAGFQSLFLAFSRDDELNADELAVKYIRKAGFDPNAMVFVLEKMWNVEEKTPLKIKNYWRTHPYIGQRLGIVREQIHGQIQFEDYINRPVD